MNDTLSLRDRIRRSTGARFAVVLLLGIALGAGAVWLVTDRSSAESETEHHESDLPAGTVEIPETAQRNASVEMARVTRTRLPATLEVTGIVAPDESRVAHVRPLARGVVERINVTLGSRVTAGQPLLTYDNVELGQLVGEFLSERAALRQAETDREVKRTSLSRAEALIKIEAIAQQELDVRRAEFRNAEAAVASAQARASKIEEQLHRFGLSDADIRALSPEADEAPHRAASHSVLRAPFAGVVTKFDVARGEVVETDKELFTIADMSSVWVLADVYEKDLSKIRRDGAVSVKVDAYPDRTFTGRITYVSDLIDPTTRSAKVRCVVENRDGALKLDMFAKVTLASADEREALVVPEDAIQQIDNQSIVFAQQTPTRFERRDVQIGLRSGRLVEIVGGLDEGQTIVGRGSFYLKTALLRERIGDEH
ncbi:MAG TPA: efflux RND transporter periplasmic adaptor subunit [Vicinamibacterales bacterium]|jgi:cobalt-zinc-cadmium efflux system membrane fusion protein|nr:efflux RND transporter periplasmic adaptor subunit [Vicinamibacterales bacterium]